MSLLSADYVRNSRGRLGMGPAPLRLVGSRRRGSPSHTGILTSFYRQAGAAAGSRTHSTLSHPLSAPDRRRSFSTWACSGSNGSCGFSRIVQSPLPLVCWRHRLLEGSGGVGGTSWFGVYTGLVCILVGHFLTYDLGQVMPPV